MQEENIGVGIILLNNKGEILLGERKNAYKAGFFGTPGGHVELAESLIDAGIRELKEEAGITVTKGQMEYIGVVRELQDNGSYNFIHFGFLVRNFAGDVNNREPDKCKEWLWFSPHQLPDKILTGHKAIIEMYLTKESSSFRDLL